MNIHATSRPPLRFLMCRPQYFAVTYSINPWMDPNAWRESGAALHATATEQWQGLQRTLAATGAAIEMVEPRKDLPDLVFTANAAVVLDRKVLLASFHHPERQLETPVFAAAFRALQARGLVDEIMEMPEGIALEGAGDCIWDAQRRLFWIASGFRSYAAARDVVAAYYGVPCVALTLADPNFYHLDTAFCALPCGSVLYYPGAFTAEALDAIHARVEPSQRIALDRADAGRFAANAVCAGRMIVMSGASEGLRARLAERGYTVIKTPLAAFLRSGGSACCLTLRLDHESQPAQELSKSAGPEFSTVVTAKAGAQPF